MTSDRPYREALDVGSWIREFEENVGRQFDPRVARAFVDVGTVLHLLPPGERERMINRALFVRGGSDTWREGAEGQLHAQSIYARLQGF